MSLSEQTELRVRLMRAGYSPIPLQGKVPPMDGWQQKTRTNIDEINLWSNLYPNCCNTGVLTRLLPTLDIDIMDQAAAEAVEELARGKFEERGWFLVRIGKAPKRAVLLRTLAPFKKAQMKLIAPNGVTAKIEILADGQQVVVAGDHPDTLRPYTWHGGEPWLIAAEELPYISEAEAHAFLAEAGELLAREFNYTLVEAAKINGANGHDHHGTVAGDWSDYIAAILTGTDLHDSTAALASKLIVGGLGNGAAVRLLRALLGASAAPHDERWRVRYDDLPRAVRTARDKFGQQQSIAQQQASAAIVPFPVEWPFPIAESSLPTRGWLSPGLFMLHHLTIVVAPSGSGKSLLTLQLSIAGALGMEWAGWRPRRACRVLIINSEDDADEMRRRLVAAADKMQVDQQALRGRIGMIDSTMANMVIATFDARVKTLVRTPNLERLVATIIDGGFDLVFVDPFAETFEGDENSNNELKIAGLMWREIARRTNAAVCLIHHTKKYASGMAGDVDAARGASALVGIARIVSTLFPMTAGEAEVMLRADQIEQRGRYLRYDDAKANLNIKSPQARWFFKETVTLNNQTATVPGDEVGVLIPWQPEGPTILEEQILTFLRAVDVGIVDDETKQPTGEFYTFENKGRDNQRKLRDFVQSFFRTDDGPLPAKAADKLIAAWRMAKRLQQIQYRQPNGRQMRWRVVSNLSPLAPSNRPDLFEFKVGDVVQVEIAGAFVFEQPVKVERISDHQGAKWVWLEGSNAAVPMSSLRRVDG